MVTARPKRCLRFREMKQNHRYLLGFVFAVHHAGSQANIKTLIRKFFLDPLDVVVSRNVSYGAVFHLVMEKSSTEFDGL